MNIRQIENTKRIGKNELLDRAGSTELAANLFRITQTEEKIRKDKVIGEGKAKETHFQVGRKIRNTIKDIGGVLPERLPTEKHIEIVKRELKAIGAHKEVAKSIAQKKSRKMLPPGKA